MNTDYLIVFPATTNYMDEACVLLKSLQKHMPTIPVHVTTRNNDADCLLKEFDNVTRIIDEPPCDTEFRQVRTTRFRHAADVAKEGYKVVCLLDADMLVVRNFTKIFKMAESGTILVGSNNTLLRYRKKDFDKMFVDVSDDINVVHPTFTTVPTFINPTIHQEYLRAIYENKTGNDLDIPNLVAIQQNLMDQIYHLPSFLFTGIHHTMLKPETYVKMTDDGLYSHQGEPVYMLHGHLGDPKYLAELIKPMRQNYGYYEPYLKMAQSCINTLKEVYEKYK